MPRRYPWVLLALLLLLARPGLAAFAPDPEHIPRPTAYVTDFAGVLDAPTRESMEALLTELDQKTTAQVAVVTVPTLGEWEIQMFSVKLFEKWKMGQKGKDNGALFLIAPTERRMWITTGYGLEEALTDSRSAAIIAVVRPYFRAGRMSEGVAAGTRALAAEVAAFQHVELTGSPERAPAGRGRSRGISPRELIFLVLVLFMILRVLSRFGRRGMFFGGGWPGGGGFYGGGSGGGFGGGGGGFGGFGGGSTGGGGAGGSW